MISVDSREVERKVLAILRVLRDSSEPLGGRIISRRLSDIGIDLGERAVRYHLRIMDEKGLTQSAGERDGRSITRRGAEELESALVSDRVGLVVAKIELLAYRTSFNMEQLTGEVPIDTSLFPEKEFGRALEAMKHAFGAGLCVSELVAVAREGEKLGDVMVPQGRKGLASIDSIAVSGALLKAGIPLDSKFAGILQIRNGKPLRFTDLIAFSGCSLDPAEVFVASRMTRVSDAARTGEGKVIASLCEFPAPCAPAVKDMTERLREAGITGVAALGKRGEPICEVPVGSNYIGMILYGGLNPAAAAAEAGIDVVNYAMSGTIDYRRLKKVREL